MLHNTEENIIAAAITVGIVAACAVIFAFWKPTRRFLCGSRLFADVLAAGIVVRAVGTLFAGSSVILRNAFGVDWLTLYLTGWAFVVGGYFLHFSAWQAAYFNRRTVLAYEVAVILALLGLGAYGLYSFVNPVPATLRAVQVSGQHGGLQTIQPRETP